MWVLKLTLLDEIVPNAHSVRAGFAETTLVANAAPTGGYVEATPRTGVAALDTFNLESLGWSDDVDDLPLTYSFGSRVRTNTSGLAGLE